MRTFTTLCFVILMIGSLHGIATAQDCYYYYPFLATSLEEDGLHLQFSFLTTYRGNWTGSSYAVDLYRRTGGFGCGEFERITPDPIVWTCENPVSIEFVDTTTIEGNVYEYMFRSVDEQRMPLAEHPDASAGYVSHGEALIGHGELVDCGPGWGRHVYGCHLECLPSFAASWPVELNGYANTGQTLLIYGRITGTGANTCGGGAFQASAVVTRAEPYLCLVEVEQRTWGGMKSLYR